MRQTGRTSRIIDFVIEQLFSCGNVIVTDHIAFEFGNMKESQIKNFVKKVIKRWEFHNLNLNEIKKVNHSIEKTSSGIPFIIFKVEKD